MQQRVEKMDEPLKSMQALVQQFDINKVNVGDKLTDEVPRPAAEVEKVGVPRSAIEHEKVFPDQLLKLRRHQMSLC
ncbi:hypothetical protein K7X08_012978 [Anisodus acutangulus]|uniref:Uncharacterized protein n=1 Tax=Anisodus acutangulus TaxID=402998 RepID=A0A9Q1MA98_9SOLA|nr:hypothetical protein K7X08_012978 [Anisodus acutangulus]